MSSYTFKATAKDINLSRVLREATEDVLAVVVRIPDDAEPTWVPIWHHNRWFVAIRDLPAFQRAGYDGNYDHISLPNWDGKDNNNNYSRISATGWTAVDPRKDGLVEDPREVVADLVARVRAARVRLHEVTVWHF